MPCVKGYAEIVGNTAFAPQRPWIRNMSVKENIVFGGVLDQEHLDESLEACSLTEEISALGAGVNTEIA